MAPSTVLTSMLAPSPTVVIVLAPTTREMAPEAFPDVTVTPFTVTVALASLTVGVTVSAVVPLETEAV